MTNPAYGYLVLAAIGACLGVYMLLEATAPCGLFVSEALAERELTERDIAANIMLETASANDIQGKLETAGARGIGRYEQQKKSEVIVEGRREMFASAKAHGFKGARDFRDFLDTLEKYREWVDVHTGRLKPNVVKRHTEVEKRVRQQIPDSQSWSRDLQCKQATARRFYAARRAPPTNADNIQRFLKYGAELQQAWQLVSAYDRY